MHEARYHKHNVFVTLTYDDGHLPPGGELVPAHLSKFFKDVRNALAGRRDHGGALVGHRLRYLACGEYGDRTGRPHYHVLAFGLGIRDLTRWDDKTWASAALDGIWEKGRTNIGEVTPASAAYVAQYTLKKVTGSVYCDADGVVKPAPFMRVSTRPGLGTAFLRELRTDLRHGVCRDTNGDAKPIPRFYRKKLQQHYLTLAAEIEDRQETYRAKNEKQLRANNHPDRLHAAERMHQVRNAQNQRRRL